MLGCAGCLQYPEVDSGGTDDSSGHLHIIVTVGSVVLALIIILTAIVIRLFLCDRSPIRRHSRKPRKAPKVRLPSVNYSLVRASGL